MSYRACDGVNIESLSQPNSKRETYLHPSPMTMTSFCEKEASTFHLVVWMMSPWRVSNPGTWKEIRIYQSSDSRLNRLALLIECATSEQDPQLDKPGLGIVLSTGSLPFSIRNDMPRDAEPLRNAIEVSFGIWLNFDNSFGVDA